MKVNNFFKVFSYIFIDPLLLYIVLTYGLSKIYQYVFDVESVWQTFWDRLQEVLGELENFLCVSFLDSSVIMNCVISFR